MLVATPPMTTAYHCRYPRQTLSYIAADTLKRSADLSVIPSDFSLSYLSDADLTLKSKQQGFRYFNEGYFHNLGLFVDEADNVSVSAKCYRSMRKSEKPHSLHMDVGTNRITFAFCSCQAGMIGSCSHIVGLVQALHQWQLMGFTSLPTDLSCTSLPQQWSKPRGHKIESEPVPALRFVNAKPDRKKAPVWNKLVDCRKKEVQPENISSLQALMNCGISYIVSQPPRKVSTHLGTVPIGSGLATQAQFYNVAEPMAVTTRCGALSFPKPAAITINNEILQPATMNSISLQECILIETTTRDQSESPAWYVERRDRLTASQFGLIVKRKTITEKFIASLKNPKQFSSAPTSYGKNHERSAVEAYTKASGIHTHKSGLIVNPAFPFLGASPDGKICDAGVCGLLEVKCPYSTRDCSLQESCERKDFCLVNSPDEIKLRKDHVYFYQVQGQLMVSGADFCDFVVYTKKDLHIERVKFDKAFCQSLLETLYIFYVKHYR